MKNNLFFIINPNAKNGYGKKIWRQVEAELAKREVPFQSYFSEYPGHAKSIAKSIAKKADGEKTLVVAVGGDGTFHEVMNGIITYPNIDIGLIPAGSGNDFSRGFSIPKDPIQALNRILLHRKGISEFIDVGIVVNSEKEESYFVNNMGAGFDAEISHNANLSKVKAVFNRVSLGKFIYVAILLKKLLFYKRSSVDMMVDGKPYTFPATWFVTVANQSYYGGGMIIAPDASPSDGELNVVVVNNLSRVKLLAVFVSVFWGGHTRFKEVSMLKGKTITISTERPLMIHLDGEINGYTPVTVQTVPKHLSIVSGRDLK
jgi:diacylglycerol kinase (ATP)